MSNHKLKSIKSKTCYRLVPTFVFIITITSIVLTMFFTFVLQSANAFDSDEHILLDIDDAKEYTNNAKSDHMGNLDLENISLEDDDYIFTTPQSTMQPFETFMLKEDINPTTNNHIQRNNNRRNMKAYKIVSKEPIMGNSLVKIVMAPHHVLEKLSKQHGNSKIDGDKIDESGNVPIKNYKDDGAVDRELIQSGNVNVDVFSLEEENVGIKKMKQPEKNAVHQKTHNIQVIPKYHKQPSNVISKHEEAENPFNLKGIEKIEHVNRNVNSVTDEIEDVNNVDVEKESKDVIPKIDLNSVNIPTTTTETILNDSITEAEELLSNPTTAKYPIQSSTQENIDIRSELSNLEDNASPEINDRNDQIRDIDITSEWSNLEENDQISFNLEETTAMASQEVSTENNVPLVVLKILKNRTVLVEETAPQSVSDIIGVETTVIPKSLPPVRPKKVSRPTTTTTTTTTTTSTTMSPIVVETKQSKFPKKANLVDSFSKYKSVPKLDDISMELTLLDVETTQAPTHSDTAEKAKNTKRAVGDEGTFSNIVRPSPMRQPGFGSLLKNETDAERAERLSKSMQRLMHFVTVVGQIDSLLTKRFRTGLRNVAKIFDSIENTRRRRSNSL